MPIRDENPEYKHINEGLKPGGLTYNVELAPLNALKYISEAAQLTTCS